MAKQYLVRTPNKDYNGVTYGIRFYNGEGLIAPHTLSPFLDWTVEQITKGMKRDFGYEVLEIDPTSGEVKAKSKRAKKTARKENYDGTEL